MEGAFTNPLQQRCFRRIGCVGMPVH
jgi:hypothetical protein